MGKNELKIIGKSKVIKEFKRILLRASLSEECVMFMGETGVGKDLSAKVLHNNSLRKDFPLIKINCCNLNENLFESELFGYKKGAFTGAYSEKIGLLEAANKGTFFFDEIGELPIHLQAKLLNVIEENKARRIGAVKDTKLNIRFIYATNRDLNHLRKRKLFRDDLFFRINVLPLIIPPLRERKEDIPLLAYFFLHKLNLKKNITLTEKALEKMQNHSFPGNVRELENVVKRAIFFAKNQIISENEIHFFPLPLNSNNQKKVSQYSPEKIITALLENNGNKTKAANELGISRVHFYRILKTLIK